MNLNNDLSNRQMAATKSERGTNGTNDLIARLTAAVRGPLPVIAGPVQGSNGGRTYQMAAGDDQDLLERTADVRLLNETLMQFYARVGLGPTAIRAMSKEEISRFCEIVKTNAVPYIRHHS